MDEWDAAGLIHWPKGGGFPRRRAEEPFNDVRSVAVGDVWTDIDRINQAARERLGYPTQKPEALLERIIRASSNEGDTVLDPFCGCGTAISVSQRLGRRWIGIDITHLAIALIKGRLQDAFSPDISKSYKVIGEPVDLAGARALAREKDRYQFQYWALGLVGARPLPSEQKKGADKGIDGRLFFHDDTASSKTKQVIFSVKSGPLKPDDLRAVSHVLEREKAEIGVLISIEEPSQKMRADAASVGFYQSPWGTAHPRLQILTIAELLEGWRVDMPPSLDFRTFKKAPKAKRPPRDRDMLLKFGGAEDLADLRQAKAEEASAPTVPLNEVKKLLGLDG